MDACIPLDDPQYPPHEPVPWKRREQIGLATLYLGDCRDIALTLERPAAVISDPPYGVSERTERKAAGRGKLAECNDFPAVYGDDKPFDPLAWLGAADRVILWGANHYCSRVPDSPSWLIWDKRDGIPSNDNADCEIAWSNVGGPARVFRHLWNGMIRASEKDASRVHPTQKPTALMRWCIERAKVPACGLILDPYMGSGSTGVAAMQMRHPFIGIEIEERYFDVACRRIEEAQKQGDMFRDALS